MNKKSCCIKIIVILFINILFSCAGGFGGDSENAGNIDGALFGSDTTNNSSDTELSTEY